VSKSEKLCWWLITWWGISAIVMLLAFGFLNITPWVPVTEAVGQGPRIAILLIFFTGGLICAWYSLYQCMSAR
jgi:hypothetical protein